VLVAFHGRPGRLWIGVGLRQILDVDLGAGGRGAEEAKASEGQRRQNRDGDGSH
jgi:hypothetical protein